MRKRHPAPQSRRQSASRGASSAVSQTPSTLAADDLNRIQELLKSGDQKGVHEALLQLQSLEARLADYEKIFTEPVIRAIVGMWSATTQFAIAKQLLPHREVCKRFIAMAAKGFCHATESERLQFLQDLFHQPYCCGRDGLHLDMAAGTILWDVLHRELLAAGRISMQYREDEFAQVSTCIIKSLNGIHLAGFFRGRGEGRPGGIPHHVLQASDLGSCFPDSSECWVEIAWAVSCENIVEGILSRTSDNWVAHEWAWDNGEHLIIATLWSWFNGECLSGNDAAKMGVRKHKKLFQWTEKGSRALVAYTNKLLFHRRFVDPHVGSVAYLPWQYPGAAWPNEFEVRFRKGKKRYASYASLSDELKQLAFLAAISVRDAAKRIKPKSEGFQVIEGLANHSLICLALHPATSQGVVQSLASDAYEPVALAATAGRTSRSDQRSPAEKMTNVVDDIIRGTGGRSPANKASDDVLAVAKRLSQYWSRWKQEDTLDEVAAVNTEDPRKNEDRMRAVAMGVAVARGWVVPTKEGISLMRKSVAELDVARGTRADEEDGDD